jgi:hypothetical protein
MLKFRPEGLLRERLSVDGRQGRRARAGAAGDVAGADVAGAPPPAASAGGPEAAAMGQAGAEETS